MRDKQGFKPTRRLEERPLRGRFAITDAAVAAAERVLPTFRGPDGDHEGIVFLAGFELAGLTLFTAVIAPEAEHGRGHVFCSREQMLAAQRGARASGVSILGQLHSHPGPSSYHSKDDDEMVHMPFEGMLSLVAPRYALWGLRPLENLGVHQFQDGRWVVCERKSVHASFRVLPSEIDLR
jgi:proteasome lid subunit RPN8/RPN11